MTRNRPGDERRPLSTADRAPPTFNGGSTKYPQLIKVARSAHLGGLIFHPLGRGWLSQQGAREQPATGRGSWGFWRGEQRAVTPGTLPVASPPKQREGDPPGARTPSHRFPRPARRSLHRAVPPGAFPRSPITSTPTISSLGRNGWSPIWTTTGKTALPSPARLRSRPIESG